MLKVQGGNLGFMFSSYFGWENSNGNYRGKIGGSIAQLAFYKRALKNYVKWKRVDDNIIQSGNDTIVVVEQNSEKALGNDKDDKEPGRHRVRRLST